MWLKYLYGYLKESIGEISAKRPGCGLKTEASGEKMYLF